MAGHVLFSHTRQAQCGGASQGTVTLRSHPPARARDFDNHPWRSLGAWPFTNTIQRRQPRPTRSYTEALVKSLSSQLGLDFAALCLPESQYPRYP